MLGIKLNPLSVLFQLARYHPAFILFEETTYFHLCALCACGRDGSRAYFAHNILTRTTRVFLIFVTSAQLINREFLAFPSVNFFKNRLIS